MSTPTTSASGRSAASDSAMQPLPVPTSTIDGPLDAAKKLERRFDEQLRLRARDEHVGRHHELVAPERLACR